MSAAIQAELMEKEKHVVELQMNIQGMKQQLQTYANHQIALQREKKRCEITVAELSTLPADHHVYKGIGRLFASIPVADLTREQSARDEKCTAESQRLGDEKVKLGNMIQQEEEKLKVQLGEFLNMMKTVEQLAKVTASK